MKKLLLAVLLLLTPVAFASTNEDPADFTITVNVVSSGTAYQFDGTFVSPYQVLETVVDGQPLQMTGGGGGVLLPGKYQAKLSTKVHAPKNANSADLYRYYDFLLPGGAVRTYTVSRLGPPACGAPGVAGTNTAP